MIFETYPLGTYASVGSLIAVNEGPTFVIASDYGQRFLILGYKEGTFTLVEMPSLTRTDTNIHDRRECSATMRPGVEYRLIANYPQINILKDEGLDNLLITLHDELKSELPKRPSRDDN